MRFIVLCLTWSFYSQASGASAPALKGVWEGTVGTKPVMACFNADFPSGSYYYKQFLKPIQLTTNGIDKNWHEEGATGIWELATPFNGVMGGRWRSPKTKVSRAIELRLVGGADVEKACALRSYNAAIEKPPKIETGKYIKFSPNRSYRKMRFAGQETIELAGPDPATARINHLLKLDTSKTAIDGYFEQRREFLGRVGMPAVDEVDVKPEYWDANFITVDFYTWTAGEGRNGISNTYRTWNVVTGEEVELREWLGVKSGEAKLPPKLYQYLFKGMEPSPECRDGYRGQGEFTLQLKETGLNVYEESWGSGCEEDFTIPYAKLLPFLSPKGKLAVKSILKSK